MRNNRKRSYKSPSRLRTDLSQRMPILAIAAATLIVIGSILFDHQSIPQYIQLLRALEEIRTHIHELEQRNAALRQEIVRVEHDPLKLEEIARNRLGMVRPDDMVYQFVVPQPSLETSAP